MIADLPHHITILFLLTVIGTLFGFQAATRSRTFLLIATGWIVLQSILALGDVYQDTAALPPRLILFGILPALIAIAITLLVRSGKSFIGRIDLKRLTLFHAIRIPVEVVLALLYHQGKVSVFMTFEGTNFDLFSGLTAPLVAYLAFRSSGRNDRLLIGWNILCLLLLLNVVITAAFALPSPFQQLSFDQPNVAVLYFPFNLLPVFIVPTVLFAHLAAFRQLARPADHARSGKAVPRPRGSLA